MDAELIRHADSARRDPHVEGEQGRVADELVKGRGVLLRVDEQGSPPGKAQ